MLLIIRIIQLVPAVPTLLSVHRLSGSSATVNWIPLTQDEARGLLISLEIAYEPVTLDSTLACSNMEFIDSEMIFVRENLFEQSSATITSLEPNHEYCFAIRVNTSGGGSGFSNSIKLLCKMFPQYSFSYGWLFIWYCCTYVLQYPKEFHSRLNLDFPVAQKVTASILWYVAKFVLAPNHLHA